MKAFEEWSKTIFPEIPSIIDDNQGFNQWLGMKRGWKATLKWALTQQVEIGYNIPVVLVDIIEKELEE